jgi:DNA-binding NarL/FixJ family response regulator
MSSAPIAASPARILIIEDETIVALDLRAQLEARGHVVVGVAGSAAEAMDLARSARPDLALTDIRLRGGDDGIEVAEALARELGTAVVFLTAYRDAATLQRSLAARPHGFVTKPFDANALHTAVDFALYSIRSEAALSEQRARAEVAERVARTSASFYSQMSHELRTPLNAILGFGQLLCLQLEPKEPALARQAALVVKAGEEMLALVDALLAHASRRPQDDG